MQEPLQAKTFNEVRYYLMVTSCRSCGRGPLKLDTARQRPEPGQPPGAMTVEGHCGHCGERFSVQFSCQYDLPLSGPEADCINPSGEPSAIVDLSQWISLFYLLLETAASEQSKPATRRAGFMAALCLAEALKFYEGDDELPPAAAFFSEATAEIFRQHPERFARQKLLDMRAKLPGLHTMAVNVARDRRGGRRKWWRFWKRQPE